MLLSTSGSEELDVGKGVIPLSICLKRKLVLFIVSLKARVSMNVLPGFGRYLFLHKSVSWVCTCQLTVSGHLNFLGEIPYEVDTSFRQTGSMEICTRCVSVGPNHHTMEKGSSLSLILLHFRVFCPLLLENIKPCSSKKNFSPF